MLLRQLYSNPCIHFCKKLNYIVDFYCSQLRLVIEIDGDSHAETVEYDTVRTNVLESLGLHVIRFTNDDVLRNIEGVYEELIKTTQAGCECRLSSVAHNEEITI